VAFEYRFEELHHRACYCHIGIVVTDSKLIGGSRALNCCCLGHHKGRRRGAELSVKSRRTWTKAWGCAKQRSIEKRWVVFVGWRLKQLSSALKFM